MRFLLILIPFVFIVGCFEADAQILNIERARADRDSVNFLTGKAGFNFSLFNRNAGKANPNNYLQLNFTGDVAYISGKHSYLLLNYFNYMLVNYNSEERTTVASTGYSHFRVNFLKAKKLSYEAFAQVQADKARGLDLRTLAGVGLRYRLLRTENANLYAGSGLMHEHETWEEPELEGVNQTANLIKWTNYISTKVKFNDYVGTEAIVYYQTGYDKTIENFRNRVSGDVALQVKLNGRLSFRTTFNCTFEDRPLVPVTKFVYAVTNGIQVEF